MPSVTIRVTDGMRVTGWIDTKSDKVASSAKQRLTELLGSQDLEPPKLHRPMASTNANFWISAFDEIRIKRLADRAEMSVGEAISNLLITSFLQWKEAKGDQAPVKAAFGINSPSSIVLDQAMRTQGKSIRQEQVMLTEELDLLTSQNNTEPRILMAEAGTGVGKTASYLASAHELLTRNPQAAAFVAVPSFALANQVLQEWSQMQEALKSDIKTMALIGQGEFVSQTALMGFIEAQEEQSGEFPVISQDQIDALKQWVNDSAPYAPNAHIRHHWTVAGLLNACPDFDQEKDIRLSERHFDDDDGLRAYRQQWEDIPYTRLVVCTHAMLANLTKRRMSAQSRALKDDKDLADAIRQWKLVEPDKREQRLYEITNAIYADRNVEDGLNLLPNIDLLIVDEGHALEDAFCAALSKDVSLNSVLGDAGKLAMAHPDVFLSTSTLIERVGAAKHIREASADKILPLELGADSLFEALTAAIEQCITPKRNAGKAKLHAAKSSALYRSLLAIARAFRFTIIAGNSPGNGNANSAAVMHWSPEKGYPRVNVGRLNCSRELNYLWMNVANKSMIISGTIYENNPAPSCETLRRSLAIPVPNLMRMQPIHAQWQVDPVTLCMISMIERPDGTPRFCRPKSNGNGQVDQNARNAWLDDVAKYTIDAHKSAKGGMLVLATAFADIQDFALRIAPSIDGTVLTHAPGVTLQSLRLKFLECVKNGERPILVAAGAAWTGFDIYDPNHPNALTDLLILNAPFGVIKRTISRMLRASQKIGYFEISSQVLLLVRQAVGRLIRSPNTPSNRRIHWLDARIHSPAMSGMLSSVGRFLGRYKRRNVG